MSKYNTNTKVQIYEATVTSLLFIKCTLINLLMHLLQDFCLTIMGRYTLKNECVSASTISRETSMK